MNNLMLWPLVLLAGGQKGNQAGAMEAMLTASNQIPEAPRTLLAVTQAVDRADQQEQQQKAVAQRELDLANLINEGKLNVSSNQDLRNDPRMLYMISKVSDLGLRSQLEDKLNTQASPNRPNKNKPKPKQTPNTG